MSDILEKIAATKRGEVDLARSRKPHGELRRLAEQRDPASARDFVAALRERVAKGTPGVIAEAKRASPSKGLIRENFDPEAIAGSYEAHGAACLSVLTDQAFFRAHASDLPQARAACSLPVLRKDFIVDAYQIDESAVMGADCILLIAAILDDAQLRDFEAQAMARQLSVLVEVHDRHEMQRALALRTPLIGVNNRNLRDFSVRLENSIDLCSDLPPGRLLVAESGIASVQDVTSLKQAGIGCFLVGETFMRAANPGAALAELFFPERTAEFGP